jgi:CDP-diacylglycerol--glycerol-3-phosphate 3-phosphatidyltransferase
VSAPDVPTRRFGPNAVATPANAVTALRLVLAVPTFVLIESEGSSWATVALWVLLTSTDGLDGWLARRDGTTRSGAFLDPLADKFLVLGGFLVLGIDGAFPWSAVVLVTVREVGISVYRSYLGRRGVSLPAAKLGKWKAFLQFVAVGVVLLPWTDDVTWLHDVTLWTAVALSLVSGAQIVVRAVRPGRSGEVGESAEGSPAGAL